MKTSQNLNHKMVKSQDQKFFRSVKIPENLDNSVFEDAMYDFIEEFIDSSKPKEHVSYIVDQVGLSKFKEYVLKDVQLGPKAKAARFIDFGGYKYDRNINLDCQDAQN